MNKVFLKYHEIIIALSLNDYEITIDLSLKYHWFMIDLPWNYERIITGLLLNYQKIIIEPSLNYHRIIIGISLNNHWIIISLSLNYHWRALKNIAKHWVSIMKRQKRLMGNILKTQTETQSHWHRGGLASMAWRLLSRMFIELAWKYDGTIIESSCIIIEISTNYHFIIIASSLYYHWKTL